MNTCVVYIGEVHVVYLHELLVVLRAFVAHAAVFLGSKMADVAEPHEPRVGQGDGSSLANTDDLLNVGLEFKSYEDLSSVIKSYEQRHFVTLYKQSSRTIQASRK